MSTSLLTRLPRLALAGFIGYCFALGLVPMESFDYWTHLDRTRTLLHNWQTGQSGLIDLVFGHGLYGNLGPLIIYGFHQLFGPDNISLLLAVSSALIFLPFYMRLPSGPDAPRHLQLLLILLVVVTVRFRFMPRPELFGYLIFAWCGLALQSYRDSRQVSRLGLVALGLLGWFLLHVTWTIGLLILAFAFQIQHPTLRLHSQLSKPTVRLATMLLLIPTVWIGFKGASFIKLLIENYGSGKILNWVSEMQPSWHFHSLFGWYLAVSLISLWLVVTPKERRLLRFCAWLMVFTIGAVVERNVAIASLGMLSLAMTTCETNCLTKFIPYQAPLLLGGVLILAACFQLEPRTGYGVNWPLFPRHAAALVIKQNLPREIFNNWDCGGYLRWEWHGAPPPFMDGTLFSAERLADDDDLIEARTLAPLQRYGINTLLLQGSYYDSGRIYPLVFRLLYDPNWKLVHASDALLFTRNPSPLPRRPVTELWQALLKRLDAIRASGVDQAHYYFSKGVCYVSLGKTDQARLMFSQGLAEHPELAAHYQPFRQYFLK